MFYNFLYEKAQFLFISRYFVVYSMVLIFYKNHNCSLSMYRNNINFYRQILNPANLLRTITNLLVYIFYLENRNFCKEQF